jgi:hypothetical protein
MHLRRVRVHGCSSTAAEARLFFSPSVNSSEYPCSVAAFEVNSEPHTGARPSVRLCVGLSTWFSRLEYTGAYYRNYMFPVPNCHTEFRPFLCSYPPFFSRLFPASSLCFSRAIAHMQAGPCGNHMGAKFCEVV